MSEMFANLDPSHPEFCAVDEVEEQAKLAQFELRRKYFDDCSRLRAGYVGLLDKHKALYEDGGWILYMIDDIEGEDGLATVVGRNEVLIIVGTGSENHQGVFDVADIRVVTNQYFRLVDSSEAYMTRDFTLDEDNLSQYMPSVFYINDGTVSTAGYVPIFSLNDQGGIRGINIRSITPAVNTQAPNKDGVLTKVQPFGHHSFKEDEIYALAAGRELLDLVANAEPYAVRPHSPDSLMPYSPKFVSYACNGFISRV